MEQYIAAVKVPLDRDVEQLKEGLVLCNELFR